MLYIHSGDKVAVALLVGSHTRCLSCVRQWIGMSVGSFVRGEEASGEPGVQV